MSTSEPPQFLSSHRLVRRDFLARSAGLAIAAWSGPALLSGCTGGGTDDDALKMRERTVIFNLTTGRVGAPTLLNPFVPGAVRNQGLLQALMEPLFILNLESGEIEPWLGTKFTPNQTHDVWTLVLRKGVVWSDGEPFDADDVVFSIELLKDGPAELLNAAAMRTWVKAVTKVDPLTVRFELNRPNPRFQLDYFSVKKSDSIPIVPKHIWTGKDPLTFKNYDVAKGWPVFTGPYALKSATPTEFSYKRRSDWWGEKAGFLPLPKPERLVWVVDETEEVRVARAVDHRLDAMADVTTGAFESIKARNPDAISWLEKKPYSWVDPCVRLLSFNHQVGPWGDKDIRWAVNHAINRKQVVDIAYEGSTTPARFFFPAYPSLDKLVDLLDSRGLFRKYPVDKYDPELTARILESKGYKKDGEFYQRDGKQLRVQIDTISDIIELRRIAQVLVEQLQKVGINATLRALAFSTWGENVSTGKFESVTDFGACGSVNEPWSSMDVYNAKKAVPIGQRTSENGIRWKNAEFTRHVDELASLPVEDRRTEQLFLDAAEVWMRELPFIPITQAKKLVPFDTRYWTGWPTAEDNYIHPPTWWQSTHKIIHRLQPARK